MEEHRLKPMPEGYDVELFNNLFYETANLRKKLAFGIDHRRFGVAQEDIISFFNTKFIYAFTKYYGKPPNILKAHIIKALQTYQFRIMKHAYINKYSQTIVSTELVPIEQKEDHQEKDYYYSKMMEFMKSHLSDNALLLLEIQLNPPPYILKRINPDKDSNLQKIPNQLLLEYFDLGFDEVALKYLGKLKKEIRTAIAYAKAHMPKV